MNQPVQRDGIDKARGFASWIRVQGYLRRLDCAHHQGFLGLVVVMWCENRLCKRCPIPAMSIPKGHSFHLQLF